MSLFDPESFMETKVRGEMSTSIPPIPPGEYLCLVDTIEPKVITSKDKGEDFFILEIMAVVDDELAREATGMKEPKARLSVFMDIEDDGSLNMDEGKNTDLGRFREALGQNNADEDWSPAMMLGASFIGNIINEGTNKPGDNRLFSRIDGTRSIDSNPE